MNGYAFPQDGGQLRSFELDAEVDFNDDDDNPFDPSSVPDVPPPRKQSHRDSNYFDAVGPAEAPSRKLSGKRRSTFHLDGEEEYEGENDQGRFLDEEDGAGRPGSSEDDPDEHSEFEDPFRHLETIKEVEEDPVVVFRRELLRLQEDLHYEEWGVLTNREKLSGLLEPAVLGSIEIPPDAMGHARTYALVQSGLSLLLPYSLLMLTGAPATQAIGRVLFAICTIGNVLDILLRIATYLPKRSRGAILFDVMVSVASLIAAANGDILGGLFVYLAMLRAVRVFRFIPLYKQYETFQDVFLIQQTVGASMSILLIIALFAFIAVFISSTFLWASESTYFDVATMTWMRTCSADVPCSSNVSPFQSIPGAMWFAVNCVTLGGFGNSFPVSALGRAFAGVTCVVGVFVLAFITTILIGNLSLIRAKFFKDRDIREARITAEAIDRVTEKLEREQTSVEELKEIANVNEFLHELAKGTDPLTANDAEPGRPGDEASLEALPQLFGDGGITEFEAADKRAAAERARLVQRAEFCFMSPDQRRVIMTDQGWYMYLPILEIVWARDGLPLIGNVTRIDATTSAVTLFLCIDDKSAQDTASAAAQQGHVGKHRVVARAAPIVSMSVSLLRAHPAITLFRRYDVGEVRDNFMPLVFLVRSAHRFQNLNRLRKAFVGTQLHVAYTPAISAAAIWSEVVFVTAEMLATTKFIEELKLISVMVAPTVYFNEEEEQELDDEDVTLRKRRNIAFVQPDHIYQLLDGVFDKITVPIGASIRNREAILEAILSLILMHSRELYFRQIPALIHTAVFELSEVTLFTKLVEIDLEFFRKSEWPIGTVEVQYGYDSQAVETEITVTPEATKCGQPELAFEETLAMEYSLEDDEEEAADAMSGHGLTGELPAENGETPFPDGDGSNGSSGEKDIKKDAGEPAPLAVPTASTQMSNLGLSVAQNSSR